MSLDRRAVLRCALLGVGGAAVAACSDHQQSTALFDVFFQLVLARGRDRFQIPVVKDHQLIVIQMYFSQIAGAVHIELRAGERGVRQIARVDARRDR